MKANVAPVILLYLPLFELLLNSIFRILCLCVLRVYCGWLPEFSTHIVKLLLFLVST